METTVNQRIQAIVDERFAGNKSRFAKAIGEPATSVNNVLGPRQTTPSSRTLLRIVEAVEGLSSDWLLTGRGSMTLPGKPSLQPENISYEKGRPYYDVDFKGGFDLMVNDQTARPDYLIDLSPFNREGLSWCNLTGHSMEPEISNGDLIALCEVFDWRDFLVYGEIYGIVTANDLRTVKRIRRGSDETKLLLVPANPDYERQEIDKSLILRMFRVVGSIHRF